MAETIVETISAGRHPVYDVLVTESGSIRIRHSEDHQKHIDLISSVVPTLVNALQKAQRIAESLQ